MGAPKLLVGALALTLGLAGCTRPPAGPAKTADGRVLTAPGKVATPYGRQVVFYKGVPGILGLAWGAKTGQTRAQMKKEGWVHLVTRRTANSSAEGYSGRLLGRPAQVILDHDAKRGLVRIQFTLTPVRDIHEEYRVFIGMFEKSFGKATSLFTPDPPTDAAYRVAANQTMHPITGWVFDNGFAASVAVKQPWKTQNDTTTAIQLTLESATWRAAYRLNTQ